MATPSQKSSPFTAASAPASKPAASAPVTPAPLSAPEPAEPPEHPPEHPPKEPPEKEPPLPSRAAFFGDLRNAADLLEPLGYHLFYENGVLDAFVNYLRHRETPSVWGRVPHTDILERVTYLNPADMAERLRTDPSAIMVSMGSQFGESARDLLPSLAPGRLRMVAGTSLLSGHYGALGLQVVGGKKVLIFSRGAITLARDIPRL